jgi:mannose-6-phosphate isomerase-like protein (cupin superfamily)
MTEKRVEKPWGYEVIWAKTKDYVGKELYIKQGAKLSLQYHEEKEETIRVIFGRVRLHWFEDGDQYPRTEIMVRGDTFHIPPGKIHRFEALDDCCVAEVSTPQLDDVVRLDDDYGRDEA